MLRMGKKIFVGRTSRTNDQGIEELSKILRPYGYTIATVRTKGSLHLKSICTAIDDETLFVNPKWVELDGLSGFNLVRTPPEEPFAANVLRVGSAVCVQAGFPQAAELINQFVERVEIIDTSELRKAEAGLTCSSIIFQD